MGKRRSDEATKRRRGRRLVWLLVCIAVPQAAHADDPLERTSRKGPVEATVRIEPNEPLIGDAVTLTLRVLAAKGVELLMPQFGQAMERFTIVDFTIDERIDDEGRTVSTQTYTLEPPHSGRQSIPPIMIEFVDRRDGAKPAPEGLDAYEVLTERLSFEVRSVTPDDAAADLHPPLLDELAPLVSARRVLWPWVVLLVVIVVATPFVWRYWIRARRRARRRSAYEVATARLTRLTASPRVEAEPVDAFFVELSAIVRWYLENRFELRAEELTTEEFLDAMSQSPDLSGEHQALLRGFLRRADLVKFARFVPSESDVEQSVAAARRFLDETRLDAPLVEQQQGEPPPPGDGGTHLDSRRELAGV